MTGTVKFIGEAKGYHYLNKNWGKYVKKNDTIDLPLNECIKLWNKGLFEPDMNTLKKIVENSPPDPAIELEGKYKGRCFLIGSGESLNGFDYSRLDNEFTIGFNHIYKIYSKLKALLFIDGNFIKTDGDNLKKLQCLIFSASRTQYRDYRSNVYHFPINNTRPQDKVGYGLYNGHLSGLSGINLALIMGFDKIYLLGYDMNGGRVKDYESAKPPKYDKPDWITNKIEMFNKYKPYNDKIFNCSEKSSIDFFQYADINEVLNEKK